ncbi:hypothetical protein A6A22_10795 [Arthrobacter sp. OY3WO11]|nr:hypothetical protein A6A22_10795 [Arthrobacter sp. OY3WO11]
MRRQPESALQLAICDYLRLKYPNAMFSSDFAAGMKLTMGQASKRKRSASHRGWPDLLIAAPIGPYGGLFIELKAEGTAIYRRDGELLADPHIREQAEVLEALRVRGYYTGFGVGFDSTRQLIDDYLTGKLLPETYHE